MLFGASMFTIQQYIFNEVKWTDFIKVQSTHAHEDILMNNLVLISTSQNPTRYWESIRKETELRWGSAWSLLLVLSHSGFQFWSEVPNQTLQKRWIESYVGLAKLIVQHIGYLYWPCCCISKCTDGVPFNLLAQLLYEYKKCARSITNIYMYMVTNYLGFDHLWCPLHKINS